MSDWTAGYVADVDYTFGYYNELNPSRARLALLNSALVCPEFESACELGFGQGMSANFHSAGSRVKWFGTDFNPAQAGFARELAEISGSGAVLVDDAFADFFMRKDLPDFDFIGLHGIWSWISDENRALIVDFIRRKLKVGGVVYISYNTLPGWAAFAPMRHLMTEHSEIIGAEGRGIVSRINDAIEFADKLLATNPAFLRANPLVAERIKNLKTQNRHYLAHEYFNRDWHPMHFGTMADWLKPAKLQYACSANYIDHVDAINLSPNQQTFLKEIPDPMFRESVRDFMINQQFRRDYWIKGARRMSPLEQLEQLRKQKVVLVTARDEIKLKVNGALGEANLTEAIYAPVLDVLADHKARHLEEIEAAIKVRNITFLQLAQVVVILLGAGHLASVQEDSITNKASKSTEKLNTHLMLKSRSGNDTGYLVSPVTGGGHSVPRFHQLFLLALRQGKKQPHDLAIPVWNTLSAQGQKLIKEGTTLETMEQNIAELELQAKLFLDKQLPILKALQIA